MFFQHRLTTKDQIKEWLKDKVVGNYTIQDDLTVDVAGHVNLTSSSRLSYYQNQELPYFPFQFNVVEGNFVCKGLKLKALRGAPRIVGGHFDCSNNELKNLIAGPEEVGQDYNACKNPINSMKEQPVRVGNNLILTNTWLKDLPPIETKVGAYFYVSNVKNTRLIGLEAHYKEGSNALIISGADIQVWQEKKRLQDNVMIFSSTPEALSIGAEAKKFKL